MATCVTRNVRMAGLASAVPERALDIEDVAQQFGRDMSSKISESTGVLRRRVVSGTTCTSDLCFAAAERLIDSLSWPRDSVEALIFVSQTPDYLCPATSCSLHRRLELSKHCAAFDINLGCSGYVYGLSVASQFVSCGTARRVLLLVGDTFSRVVSPLDRSTAPLFGDAGTATALEYHEGDISPVFGLGTDGAGERHLLVPAGGFRNPHTAQSTQRKERDDGNVRADEDLYMNGPEIFKFTLCEVPPLFQQTLQAADWKLDDVDAVVMHQANAFILRYLAKKLKIPSEKLILTLQEYGNTSSASIPLAISEAWAGRGIHSPLRLLLLGFGVGWSWGAAAITCEQMVLPPIINVPDTVQTSTGRSVA